MAATARPPMTLGNMRELGPYCYAKYSRTFASQCTRTVGLADVGAATCRPTKWRAAALRRHTKGATRCAAELRFSGTQ